MIELIEEMEGKKIVCGHDAATGLRCVVAIHSTRLGPAAGGVRFKPYPSEEDAARDAMRLARAMTLKYAAAGMRMGGGKAVIVGDPRADKTPELLRAFGRFVEEMAGEYSAAEDVGTNGADMVEISRETEWLVSLPTDAGGAGDVSITTAEGVFNAIRACAERVWGAPELDGRTVAVQGLGQVGMKLARLLHGVGADLLVADLDPERARAAEAEFGARPVAAAEIATVSADVFAPCALGDAVTAENVDGIAAAIVAGAANNVFSGNEVAERLERRGTVYAVDFIANAGGIVYDDQFRARPQVRPFDEAKARTYVDGIFDRTLRTFALADELDLPLWRAGLRLAEENLDGMGPA